MYNKVRSELAEAHTWKLTFLQCALLITATSLELKTPEKPSIPIAMVAIGCIPSLVRMWGTKCSPELTLYGAINLIVIGFMLYPLLNENSEVNRLRPVAFTVFAVFLQVVANLILLPEKEDKAVPLLSGGNAHPEEPDATEDGTKGGELLRGWSSKLVI